MKSFLGTPRDYLIRCLIIVLLYVLLHQIMARTQMIEKVMALSFTWWELVLIVLFLVSRLLSYLLVPPTLVALAVYGAARRLMKGDPAA